VLKSGLLELDVHGVRNVGDGTPASAEDRGWVTMPQGENLPIPITYLSWLGGLSEKHTHGVSAPNGA
jgi:hypothetical protein